MYVVATPSTKTAKCLALAPVFVKILFKHVRRMYEVCMWKYYIGENTMYIRLIKKMTIFWAGQMEKFYHIYFHILPLNLWDFLDQSL